MAHNTVSNWNDKKLQVFKQVHDSIQHLAASFQKIAKCVCKNGKNRNKEFLGGKSALIGEVNRLIFSFNCILEKSM